MPFSKGRLETVSFRSHDGDRYIIETECDVLYNETQVNDELHLTVDHKGRACLYHVDNLGNCVSSELDNILFVLKEVLPEKEYLMYERSAFENII